MRDKFFELQEKLSLTDYSDYSDFFYFNYIPICEISEIYKKNYRSQITRISQIFFTSIIYLSAKSVKSA